MTKQLWMAAGFAVFFLGCGSGEEVTALTPERRFARAKEMFDDRDLQDAANEFTIITLQYQGSSVAADAQYYLAECRYERHDYILAAFEYAVLRRNYPASSRVADAQFKLALCYYYRSPKSQLDQEFTRKAIDEFQTFVEYYPNHASVPEAEGMIRELTGTLAKRQFEAGELYATMEYYRAAFYYFDSVIEKYHDTEYAPTAFLRKAEILYQRERYREASAELTKLIARYPHSEELKDAEKLRVRLERRGF